MNSYEQKLNTTLTSASLLTYSLHLDEPTFRVLLEQQGPSLGLWRAAEIAVLREQTYERPILDLGCGDGLVTSMVLPRVEIGVDPNQKPLAQAQERGIYEQLLALPVEKSQIPEESIGLELLQRYLEVGGLSFWSRLPRYHSGEEVLVQNLLMRRWGGCAIMPSGTYHAQVRSTVLNDAGTVDGHALDLLPEMIQRYAPEIGHQSRYTSQLQA